MPRVNSPFGGRNREYYTQSHFFPAAADAVDGWLFVHPGNGKVYELVSVKEKHATASTSGTLALRKVTAQATAPGASAGATVIEQLSSSLNLASTANTAVSGSLVSTAGACRFKDGDSLGADFGGTLTNLAGMCLTLTFLVKSN